MEGVMFVCEHLMSSYEDDAYFCGNWGQPITNAKGIEIFLITSLGNLDLMSIEKPLMILVSFEESDIIETGLTGGFLVSKVIPQRFMSVSTLEDKEVRETFRQTLDDICHAQFVWNVIQTANGYILEYPDRLEWHDVNGHWRDPSYSPNVMFHNGDTEWRRSIDGYLHREDGPAVIHSDGVKEWWFDGERRCTVISDVADQPDTVDQAKACLKAINLLLNQVIAESKASPEGLEINVFTPRRAVLEFGELNGKILLNNQIWEIMKDYGQL